MAAVGRTLEEVRSDFAALTQLVDEARRRSSTDSDLVARLWPAFTGKKVKTQVRQGAFDSLESTVIDAYRLAVVASFERDAFALLDNALGNARAVMKDTYPEGNPYFRFRAGLVHKIDRDISTLGRLREQVMSSLSPPHTEALREMVDHRDHLAHGKREGVGNPACSRSADQMVGALQEILGEINARSE